MIDSTQTNKPMQFKIETPVGSVESDSGNHTIDVLSVVGIIVLILVVKKLIVKWS
tara:strand:- start:4787 stop:4951 length:165 start_codon:yes stop_codon:yes gene_type:complete